MSKKMKVLVSVLVAVLVLVVAGTAMVMADDGSTATDNETGRKSLQARVAQNLGITEEELANAFRQAWQEMREEAFIRFLDKALQNERISQEEYDAIIEWWEQKPEALDEALLPGAFGFACPRDGQMLGIKRGMRLEIRQRLANQFTERAMERECIIQDNADEIGQWRNGNPEALNSPSPRARIFNAIRDRQMIAVPKGWNEPVLQMAD